MAGRMGILVNRRTTTAAIVAGTLLACGGARAQSADGGPLKFLENIFGGSASKSQAAPPGEPGSLPQTQPAPTPGNAPLPWSGEDGASGHPLMTASAIREAAANFNDC